jgi:hypothetical protein
MASSSARDEDNPQPSRSPTTVKDAASQFWGRFGADRSPDVPSSRHRSAEQTVGILVMTALDRPGESSIGDWAGSRND